MLGIAPVLLSPELGTPYIVNELQRASISRMSFQLFLELYYMLSRKSSFLIAKVKYCFMDYRGCRSETFEVRKQSALRRTFGTVQLNYVCFFFKNRDYHKDVFAHNATSQIF